MPAHELDLEHAVRTSDDEHQGDPCGGLGVILGEWGSSHLSFVASAGHAEYMPTMPAPATCETVWCFSEHELADRMFAAGAEYPGYSADELEALIVATTGGPSSALPDADLEWETIVRISGPRYELAQGYLSLEREVSMAPHGDDDVFDYWPSGARFLIDYAAALGAPYPNRAAARIDAVLDELEAYGDELADKVGVAWHAKGDA